MVLSNKMSLQKLYAFIKIGFLLFFFHTTLYSFNASDLRELEAKILQIQKAEEFRINRDLYNITPKTKQIQRNLEFKKKEPKQDSKFCWNLKNIDLDGITKVSKNEQFDIIKNYTNRCVKIHELDKLIDDITTLYINKGYISTKVYIKPNQNLQNDTLFLLVLEGKINSIVLVDNDKNTSINPTNIFPNMINNTLNIRDIEQGLEQINRLQSNSAIMQIQPSNIIGNSILAIYNENKQRVFSSLSLDNLGSQATGREQVGVSFALDNPLNYNDNIGFIYRKTTPLYGQNSNHSITLNYDIPYGYYTFSSGYSLSEYRTKIVLSQETSIQSSGEVLSSFIKANEILYRDQNSKVSMGANLSLKGTKNYLDKILLETSSPNLSTFTFNINYFYLFESGILTLDIAYTKGLELFGATKDKMNYDIQTPKAQFEKYNLNASYMKGINFFNLSGLLSTSFSYQDTHDVLYGLEQISVGGFYSVRGYEGVSLTGDKGFNIKSDITIDNILSVPNLSFLVGYDFGKIYSHYDTIEGQLSGGAYGLKFSLYDIFIELTKVVPLNHSSHVDMNLNQGNYTYLSASYSF